MKLSILDQSPIREGGTPHQAFQETLSLARAAESLGYTRFWVSEHHNAHCLAGSAPEVLLGAIGAATDRIRIGSGGVMLPYYSAFKVAETFSVLTNLYPDRIDLGVGRAPGGDMRTAQALATDGRPKFERFPQLVEELGVMLRDCDFQPRERDAGLSTRSALQLRPVHQQQHRSTDPRLLPHPFRTVAPVGHAADLSDDQRGLCGYGGGSQAAVPEP
tara:strand:+ start:52 stop:702 length:651 start_codon:yes stop_codon:yes gene_type:complete